MSFYIKPSHANATYTYECSVWGIWGIRVWATHVDLSLSLKGRFEVQVPDSKPGADQWKVWAEDGLLYAHPSGSAAAHYTAADRIVVAVPKGFERKNLLDCIDLS